MKRNKWTRSFMLTMLTMIMTLIVGLGAAGAADGKVAVGPVIEKFSASPANVKSGETAYLSWKVTNAKAIEIIGIEKEPEGRLPLEGTIEVWPETTTTYLLRAYGADGSVVSAVATVNVDAVGKAKVVSFTATPATVAPGETVKLAWKVSNVKSIRIIGVEKEPEGNYEEGALEVWPLVTTTYVLEATGYNGEVASASVTVKVVEKPPVKILSFEASATEVTFGKLVTLKWTTENAVKVKLVTSTGAVLDNRPLNGSISVTPNKTTTYTLVAVDASGKEIQQDITIVVK